MAASLNDIVPETGLTYGLVVVLLFAIAVGMFIVIEKYEAGQSGQR